MRRGFKITAAAGGLVIIGMGAGALHGQAQGHQVELYLRQRGRVPDRVRADARGEGAGHDAPADHDAHIG
jgi:hypothetical protein